LAGLVGCMLCGDPVYVRAKNYLQVETICKACAVYVRMRVGLDEWEPEENLLEEIVEETEDEIGEA